MKQELLSSAHRAYILWSCNDRCFQQSIAAYNFVLPSAVLLFLTFESHITTSSLAIVLFFFFFHSSSECSNLLVHYYGIKNMFIKVSPFIADTSCSVFFQNIDIEWFIVKNKKKKLYTIWNFESGSWFTSVDLLYLLNPTIFSTTVTKFWKLEW